MTDGKQIDWTDEERSRLNKLREIGLPGPLTEEMVAFHRLGLESPPEAKGQCLRGKEYDKYPNLSEDKIEHVKDCLACRVMIHCLPALESKAKVNRPPGFLQKLLRFLKRR